MRTLILAAALVAVVPLAAHAHSVMSPDKASPGAYYAGDLRISHGCAGSPTLAVRVELPRGVVSAKPQPKPGWTLTIEREPLAQPTKGEGGQSVTQRVKAITWKGRLPDDEFENFGLMLKLPAAPGPLYLPTVQTCEAGENRWTDIPAAGQAWHDVAHPAPVITLSPAATDPMAGMHHEH